MKKSIASRHEFANLGFRCGVCAGATLGSILSTVHVVLNSIELRNIAEDVESGPSAFLAGSAYLFSIPAGIALLIAVTVAFGVLGGAVGIVVGKLVFRIYR